MDQSQPPRPAEPAPAASSTDIAAEAIARMREFVGARPLSADQRRIYREASQELRQVLFHLHAYNDLAPDACLPRISAVGLKRELSAIERALVTGRRS